MLKSSCLLKNIQNNGKKITVFLQKSERCMSKSSYLELSVKIRYLQNDICDFTEKV